MKDSEKNRIYSPKKKASWVTEQTYIALGDRVWSDPELGWVSKDEHLCMFLGREETRNVLYQLRNFSEDHNNKESWPDDQNKQFELFCSIVLPTLYSQAKDELTERQRKEKSEKFAEAVKSVNEYINLFGLDFDIVAPRIIREYSNRQLNKDKTNRLNPKTPEALASYKSYWQSFEFQEVPDDGKPPSLVKIPSFLHQLTEYADEIAKEASLTESPKSEEKFNKHIVATLLHLSLCEFFKKPASKIYRDLNSIIAGVLSILSGNNVPAATVNSILESYRSRLQSRIDLLEKNQNPS